MKRNAGYGPRNGKTNEEAPLKESKSGKSVNLLPLKIGHGDDIIRTSMTQ